MRITQILRSLHTIVLQLGRVAHLGKPQISLGGWVVILKFECDAGINSAILKRPQDQKFPSTADHVLTSLSGRKCPAF